MNNAELITVLREAKKHFWTQPQIELYPMMEAAADALEVADKRIAELEKQEPTEKQVVDYCHKRCLVIVEEELFQRMKATFAQLPKEGEWIELTDRNDGKYSRICSNCHRFYIHEGEVEIYHYCPNCGAKTKGQ